MGKGRVAVFRVSTSVSATPVKPGKTYPLSVLDHAMAKHRIRAAWYFAKAGEGSGREALKESLTEVLNHYPAVTGRLAKGAEDGNWVVKYNDAGLRVVEATVSVGMDEWFSTADEDEEEELTHWEEMGADPYIWSPFYVQISEFKCGGFAIGLTCPHMYADFTTVTLIVKAWADAHRGACIVHPPFFHPPALRGRPKPNTSTTSATLLYHKSLLHPPSPPILMSTLTFRFSDQSVRSLLSQINPHSPLASPFDALASLFWWRVASHSKPPTAQALTVCIDFRKRMYAPLPHGFFGTALHFSTVEMGGEELPGEGWWGHAAEKVRAHVGGLDEEEYWSALEWSEGRRGEGGKYGEPFQMYGPGLTCVMLDHLFAYGPHFEEGGKTPVHVSYRVEGHVEGEGLLLVLPHPEDGDGRTVVATLPINLTEEIRRDEVIARLGGALVFGGGA